MMLTLLSALIVAAAVGWGAAVVARELRWWRDRTVEARTLDLLTVFTPAIAAASDDPRALLVWQPIAAAARQLFPDAFGALDRAAGARFPFSPDQIQAAHARWTADWLAWELAHDAEFKLKAAAAEAELARSGGDPVARARLDAVEREKLALYQRHYADYVRIAKALQALLN